MMGFFAGVRNYSKTIVLTEPRGLPENADDESVDELTGFASPADNGYHHGGDYGLVPATKTVAERLRKRPGETYSHSWLSASELQRSDYDQELLDQRENPALITTYRDFLGPLYFSHLQALAKLGKPEEVRLLFCFT